ncbi:MAG: hypothetical protein JO261_03905, partial [Alphaproteobacteria bacterium]|nr:hypothetical protein [Alphaproteobacteria bacterium]
EGTAEYRYDGGSVALSGALFGWNDPAGVVIAEEGWTLTDRPQGLFSPTRLPDLAGFGSGSEVYGNLFTEMDGRPGWYGDLSWQSDDFGQANVVYYDNEADPRVIKDNQIAWATRFWEAGFEKQLGKFTLLAQGLSGATTIIPSPFYRQTTDFRAAYALVGYDMGPLLFAARGDIFQTRTRATFPSDLNEDGHAVTLSMTWLPEKWLRFTGELIALDDRRDERVLAGDPAHQDETQFQLLARVYF